MKNFSRFSLLALVLVTLVGSAHAVDLVTEAHVTIVEGIELSEVAALNFGQLALRHGTLVVNADGTYTDDNNMVYSNANIAAGNFSVTASEGANLTASGSAGAAPDGLTLGTFTFRWNATTPGAGYNLAGSNTTADLEVGASLAVNATEAEGLVGAPQTYPYTLSVVFQ